MNSAKRQISIESPFGDVNINAFTGITINAPNGDVKIIGKNVEIRANNNLKLVKGNILFSSHDHEFIETVATRIIELTPNGTIDKLMEYDEYISSEAIREQKEKMYGTGN